MSILAHFGPFQIPFWIISKFIYYVNIISDIYAFFADLYVSHLWFICKSLKHKSLDSIIQIWNNIQGCMTPIIMQNSCMISECCYPFNQFIKCIRDPRWAKLSNPISLLFKPCKVQSSLWQKCITPHYHTCQNSWWISTWKTVSIRNENASF